MEGGKKKSKHNLIILIMEAAKVLSMSLNSGLCAFAPCNFLPEILLATYHMSKYCRSFRTPAKHRLNTASYTKSSLTPAATDHSLP